MKENILKTKSFNFAVESVKLHKKLTEKNEFILSKQFVRSSTSIGANVREANNAQSKADFIHKLSISQKECDETMFWLELMIETEYIDKMDFVNLHSKSEELLRLLRSSIMTVKKSLGK
jgi:four helix bundle protein